MVMVLVPAVDTLRPILDVCRQLLYDPNQLRLQLRHPFRCQLRLLHPAPFRILSGPGDATSAMFTTHGVRRAARYVVTQSLLISHWLKTFDDYYNSEVSKILPSMLTALAHDSTLRFNWAETGFLRKWWTSLEIVPK